VGTLLVAGHDQLGALPRDRPSESLVDYFVTMFRMSLTPSEQDAVVALVYGVRGTEPLRPFLAAIGVEVGEIMLPSEVYCQVRLVLERVSVGATLGLRFLIAAVAFGVFFALLNYRSPGRRVAFIIASVVIPIVANGLRALGSGAGPVDVFGLARRG